MEGIIMQSKPDRESQIAHTDSYAKCTPEKWHEYKMRRLLLGGNQWEREGERRKG
jgi:hypothetical protein